MLSTGHSLPFNNSHLVNGCTHVDSLHFITNRRFGALCAHVALLILPFFACGLPLAEHISCRLRHVPSLHPLNQP